MLNTKSPIETTKIATNEKLTAERFEVGGVMVTNTAVPTVAPPPRLVPNQPSKTAIVREGEAAMERLESGRDWNDFIKVMQALDIGRSTALAEGKTNRLDSPAYRAAFAKWLRLHPKFEAIHKSDRSRFLKCFDNLDDINAWRRDHVSPNRLLQLNYPPTVLKHWERWKRAQESEPNKDIDASLASTPPQPSLAESLDHWAKIPVEHKPVILDREKRTGLLKIMSPALLAEFEDALIGQDAQTACFTSNLATALTKLLRAELLGNHEPDSLLGKMEAKLRASGRDHRDVLIGINTRMNGRRRRT